MAHRFECECDRCLNDLIEDFRGDRKPDQVGALVRLVNEYIALKEKYEPCLHTNTDARPAGTNTSALRR